MPVVCPLLCARCVPVYTRFRALTGALRRKPRPGQERQPRHGPNACIAKWVSHPNHRRRRRHPYHPQQTLFSWQLPRLVHWLPWTFLAFSVLACCTVGIDGNAYPCTCACVVCRRRVPHCCEVAPASSFIVPSMVGTMVAHQTFDRFAVWLVGC